MNDQSKQMNETLQKNKTVRIEVGAAIMQTHQKLEKALVRGPPPSGA